MNKPQFQIYGSERRSMKKDLSLLRYHIRMIPRLDPVLWGEYNREYLEDMKNEAIVLEAMLAVPYNPLGIYENIKKHTI